ncbi:fimbrial protein [Pseudomonas fluorescens]|nr:fimbrial protein [Pseudomonas fluorescens]
MKYVNKLIAPLLLGLPIAAEAACDRYANARNDVSFATIITVPENLPVGSLITSQPFGGDFPYVLATCPSATSVIATGRFTEESISLPGLNGIFRTNIAGVGLRVSAVVPGGDPVVQLRNEAFIYPPGQYVHDARSMRAEFYKLGPVSNGTFPAGTLVEKKWNGNLWHHLFLNNSIRFVNPAATCDLAAGDVNRTIALPNIKISDLTDTTSAGAANFELTANCNSVANASTVTFHFTGTPDATDPSRFANTGTAGGISLWLYSRIGGANQTIRADGTDSARAVAVSNNRAVLPLGAAYFKTGTVSQGTLASTATVNITYN